MGGVEYYIETLSCMLMERANFLSLCVPLNWPPFTEQRNEGLPASAFHWFKACDFCLRLWCFPLSSCARGFRLF